MGYLKDIVQMLGNYVLNNQLYIDESTFFTIVIGQITIYGILLTFYQFVASYQGTKKAATSYLGNNITEYFIKKKIIAFNLIISRKLFGIVFVLEILYVPCMAIFGGLFSTQQIRIMNFAWFLFVIFYFVIFVIQFIQCTKSILVLKLHSDAKTNGGIIHDINKKFMKKTLKERICSKERAVDLLRGDFKNLGDAIKCDDNPDLQQRYNDLIYDIFSTYIEQKKSEISKIGKNRKTLKNKVPWIYDANCEIRLLREILGGKYFSLDENNTERIFFIHMELLKINLEGRELEGYQKVSCKKYESLCGRSGEKVFDASGWMEITLKMYQNLNDEVKRDVVYFLQVDEQQEQNLYKIYCNECVLILAQYEIESVFEGERQQTDFAKIFAAVIKEETVNDFCADIIRDKIILYSKFDVGEIINQLNERNCTYLFSYIIMYYSIYRFRLDWEYINISVLKDLWDRQSSKKSDIEDVIKRIEKSNIGHRFNKDMYIKFLEYVEESFVGVLLAKVKNDNMLDVFNLFIIKICVINSDYSMYIVDKIDEDIQIIIINELSKHDELMENQNVINWIYHMRYNYFAKWERIPDKLNISLRSLLLTNLNSIVAINYASERYGLYANSIGAYLLIKVHELSKETRRQKSIKDAIRATFIASNMNVDEFINMLEKECNIFKCEINYVQKEKMKEYLLRTF